MFDRTVWEFINSFSSWLSAVGTLLAVFVSLHLARRDQIIRLAINAGIRKMVKMNQKIVDGDDIVTISITNTGHRTATITGICWRAGTFRKYMFDQVPGANSYSSTLPVKLSDGDEAFFRIPMKQFEQGAESIIKGIDDMWFPILQGRSIKVGVYTSTSGVYTADIDKNLRDWFIKKVKEYRHKQPTG
ncbi:MAG: hypothetical protein EPO39_11590 [Candidatus Manganitrophaceae bacterium]|nr:MAG: hypothetical protein EPO39_11590 [Candidatus Manganitrophaceae bacterium]